MFIRKHVYFYGRVQGVGFRWRAVQTAKDLHLTGWVRNMYNGNVEMEVQGNSVRNYILTGLSASKKPR